MIYDNGYAIQCDTTPSDPIMDKRNPARESLLPLLRPKFPHCNMQRVRNIHLIPVSAFLQQRPFKLLSNDWRYSITDRPHRPDNASVA